jgi:hypothetical protein
MRKPYIIAIVCLVLVLAAFAGLQWLEARSATALLETARRIRPHATIAEVTQMLGPASYTLEAPDLPPWLRSSAVGTVTHGTVLVYTISGFRPKLLIIHFLPDSGVQFVTWEPT